MEIAGASTTPVLGSEKRIRTMALWTLGIGLSVLFYVLFAAQAQAASMYTLVDDPTGGQCPAIGIWDDVTNTCTLTADIAVLAAGDTGIEIVGDGITLDGDGHQISGLGATFPPPDPGVWVPEYGVKVTGDDAEVRDLVVHDIDEGIFLNGSTSTLIIDDQISNSARGVALVFSNGNAVANSYLSNNIFAGIDIAASDTNEILGNTIVSSPLWGVRMFEGDDNLISGNLISNKGTAAAGEGTAVQIFYEGNNSTITMNTLSNASYGVDVDGGTGNEVIRNYFINNVNQAEDVGGNIFNLAAPTGGNRWDDFDEPAEGCNDILPADGFCDSPYIFSGNQDNLPLLACAECPGDLAVEPLAASISLNVERIMLRSRGLVTVTIFGSEDLPVADIDRDSINFAGAAPNMWFRPRDVDRDGFDDLVVNFRVSDMNLVVGDTEACLSGEMIDGTAFAGCGAVTVR